jgi:hypothetical protein
MGSRKQVERRKRQAEVARRRKERLRDPDGWRPPPPPEAAWLALEPLAAPDEPVEDIALFDTAALAALPPETRAEAALIREALELAAAGEPQAALDRLVPIGRQSGYADWRLFLRGLAPFQAGDLDGARDAWNRLATDRRPGRIAAVLASAWEDLRGGSAAARQPTAGRDPRAAAAALLARSSLWPAAREVAAIRHRDEDRTFSASQAALVIRLEKQYQSIDPDFVNDFSAACRFLAMAQDDEEPLAALTRGTAGPPDDPRSTRLVFTYLRMFAAESTELRACIRDYVDRDLAGLVQLPAAFRSALASTGLCLTAESILEEHTDGPLAELSSGIPTADSRQEDQVCERLLREALERCPCNQRAHEALVTLLERHATRKPGSHKAEAAVVAAKKALVEQFPDRHAHLLDLIDRLVAKDEFEKAEPLVRLLADQRCTLPAARAIPWRFELVRAGRLATKPGGLPRARGSLAAAIAAWPPWMSRQWIPFLEATLLICEGAEDGYAAALAAARQATPPGLLADAFEYEALVQLAGPPARVKQLAASLRQAAQQPEINADVGPLVSVGCFYLDLERSGLDPLRSSHPARALGRALVNRVGQQGKWALGLPGGGQTGLPVDEPAFWAAFRWVASHQFFEGVNPKREPRGFTRLADSHPRAAAEVLSWLVSAAPDTLTSRRSLKRLALVEGFLPTETNPEVREWLTTVVARVRQAADEAKERKWQARRDARRKSPAGFEFPLPPGFEASADVPPLFRLMLERGGTGALAELIPLLMGPKTPRNAERIATLCMRHDISPPEFMAALAASDAQVGDSE